MKLPTKKTAGWVATAMGAVGILMALIQAYGAFMDVRTKARDAKEKSVAGYEVLNPAILELQDIADEVDAWAEGADNELVELRAAKNSLETRLARLEGYIIAKHGSMPEPVVLDPGVAPDLPPVPKRAGRAGKSTRDVPKNINRAQEAIFD